MHSAYIHSTTTTLCTWSCTDYYQEETKEYTKKAKPLTTIINAHHLARRRQCAVDATN